MLIIGAGNLGIHILDQLLHDNYKNNIYFYDDKIIKKSIYGKFRIIRKISEIAEIFKNDSDFIVGVGHPRLRKKLTEKFEIIGGRTCSLIHNSVFVSNFVVLNHEIIAQPNAVIAHDVIIGRSCVLHTGSVIGHGAIIGDYVSIAPNVTIVGPTEIGNCVSIGANSVILAHIKIGNNVIVGAGCVVDKNLKDYETYIG